MNCSDVCSDAAPPIRIARRAFRFVRAIFFPLAVRNFGALAVSVCLVDKIFAFDVDDDLLARVIGCRWVW